MNSYTNFFAGSATIAGALVGLLFVALSIQPERNRDRRSVEHRAVAGSAFTALVDALFISLIGLQPGGGLRVGAILLGSFGLISSGSLATRLWIARHDVHLSRRWLSFMLFIIGVYVAQAATGLLAVSSARAASNTATFIYIMFGMGIARAWELLGMQGNSVIRQLHGSFAHASSPGPADEPAPDDPPAVP
ncbi:MAG TPA: hypothetical protein VGD68_01355 [Streptosporangiaceae bacterium]